MDDSIPSGKRIVVRLSPGEDKVPKLRLLDASPAAGGHGGELTTCAYTPDGGFILSGGWDGHLRLWEAKEGNPVGGFHASKKPISACAVAPDGKHAYSGCLDGLLAKWDIMTQQRVGMFLAHGRPISAIVFGATRHIVATASWDSNIILWDFSHDRDGRTLSGHDDIVGGCRFSPDSKSLVSWSHDGTMALWEVTRGQRVKSFTNHSDRVTTAAVSPDGLWLVSGARDGELKLWDFHSHEQARSCKLAGEIRACFFLLDGATLLAIDASGRMTLHTLPDLEIQGELTTSLRVQTAALAPSGEQIALGDENGHLRLVALEDFDQAALLVTATRMSRRTASKWQRFLGRSQVVHSYQCTCPICRQSFELPGQEHDQPTACPNCRRTLKVSSLVTSGQDN